MKLLATLTNRFLSNKEQLAIWISSNYLEPHEDVIGLYKVDDISADTLVQVIKDALISMNMSLKKCRGQCYDGASNRSGTKTGVAKQLKNEEPRTHYLYCHCRALHLAAVDAVKKKMLSYEGCHGHHL